MEENKNKNNVLTIILVVLLLIAVGVICYLLGSNSVKDSDNKNNEKLTEEKDDNKQDNETSIIPVSYSPKCSDSQTQQQNLLVDIDETKYNNIFEYVQEQKNVKILVNHCKVDESHPNADNNGFVNGTYELTDSEEEIVINEMKNSQFGIAESGIGGACVSGLEITYERNNKEYYISYWGLFAMSSNDGNIYKILDKSVNNTLSEPQYCLYYFNNLSSTANSILNRLTSN